MSPLRIFFVMSLLACTSCVQASAADDGADSAAVHPLMRDVFAAMPDTLLPLVSRNNRLDCIDYIENNMEARVRNVIDEYVTLEALTKDYARFRTSPSGFMELKLMADTLLCVVRTVEAGRDSMHVEDSRVAFFSAQWEPLPAERYFRMPGIEDFIIRDGVAALSDEESRVVEALRYFCPVRIALSPDEAVLTIIPQTSDLERGQRDVARRMLRSKKVELLK